MTLSWKLASHYVGLFKIIEQINLVAFYLLWPASQKVHNIFHASQLKPAIDFVPGLFGFTPAFWPPMDDTSKSKVEDIFDSCVLHHVLQLIKEFFIKQRGYVFFEAPWEPLANLTN